jgi:UPF0755 protein
MAGPTVQDGPDDRAEERTGVAQRDRESATDSDPHGLLFGSSDGAAHDSGFNDGSHDGFGDGFGDDGDGRLPTVQRVSRSERRAEAGHRARRQRNRRALWIMSALLVLVAAAATFLVVLPVYHYLVPADYDGRGTGTVVIEVQPNDDASAIAKTLKADGVVASERAFTDAADDNAKSRNIQPGSYQLRRHMSAKNALGLLLDPAARVKSDVVVTEGATTLDVVKRLIAPPCSAGKSAVCGPGMNRAAVTKALENVKALGLPTDYLAAGKSPASAEGFLYPATYFFPARTGAEQALGQMISNFTDEARKTNFTAAAKANKITPYQQLIVASIAQSEAKFPEDFAKVARVILNRITAGKPLQIDATSRYGAQLQGLNPSKVNYATFESPYNTYLHEGLTPTPISNPGAEAMDGAAHPVAGNWLYYVNGDAEGHLFFTSSETAFAKAAEKCRTHHWGCG